MVGPIEAYVLSGRLAAEKPELLVWEFPYTYVIRERHLRQVLGAIRSKGANEISSRTVTLSGGAGDINVEPPSADADLISLRMDQPGDRNIEVQLDFASGASKTIHMQRTRRVEEAAVLDTWWADLSRHSSQDIAKVSVKLREDSAATSISIGFYQTERVE